MPRIQCFILGLASLALGHQTPASVPTIEYLFSIPNTGETRFGTTLGGLLITNHGVFLHNWRALYSAPRLPTRFEELTRLPLPEDFNILYDAFRTPEAAYYFLGPLLNENGTSRSGVGYLLGATDLLGPLEDYTDAFSFSEEYTFQGQTYVENRMLYPEHLRAYGGGWIASYDGPLSLYRFDPTTHERTLIEGSAPTTALTNPAHWDFAIIDNVLVTGGEQFLLDSIVIYRGLLSKDGARFLEPERTNPFDKDGENPLFELIGGEEFYNHIYGIANRDIRVWHAEPRTRTFFGAGEGVIIRSTDMARSFQFVQKYDGQGCCPVNVPPADVTDFPDYPYLPYLDFIQSSGKFPYHVLIAGSDKGSTALYLGYSTNNGDSWENYRELIGAYGEIPVFLEQVTDGIFYIGITRRSDQTLNVLRITLPDPIMDRFAECDYLGNSWWDIPWLGTFYGAAFPWVFSWNQQSWYWIEHMSEDAGWAWTTDRGWIWTEKTVYPWVWVHQSGWQYDGDPG